LRLISVQAPLTISIHAPRGGSDCVAYCILFIHNISIHAPRGGSDFSMPFSMTFPGYFNPRSPWGERLAQLEEQRLCKSFQSTLPVGGATIFKRVNALVRAISIHAPRGGSDAWPEATASRQSLFQSTLPVGGATLQAPWAEDIIDISIHAPRGGSDGLEDTCWILLYVISIHAPRGGSDAHKPPFRPPLPYFNPRSPWGERLLQLLMCLPPREYFNPRSPWGERPVVLITGRADT